MIKSSIFDKISDDYRRMLLSGQNVVLFLSQWELFVAIQTRI